MGGIMMPYLGDMSQQGYVTPNTIPSLTLWYNASASSTVVNGISTANFDVVVSDGTALSKWKDLQAVAGDSNTNGGTGKNPNYAIPIQNGLGSVFFTSANSECFILFVFFYGIVPALLGCIERMTNFMTNKQVIKVCGQVLFENRDN